MEGEDYYDIVKGFQVSQQRGLIKFSVLTGLSVATIALFLAICLLSIVALYSIDFFVCLCFKIIRKIVNNKNEVKEENDFPKFMDEVLELKKLEYHH